MKKRAMKKYIPKDTSYCYKFLKLHEDGWGYDIKPCPWYKRINSLKGYCSYCNCDVMDMCKSCGEKEKYKI